MKRNGGWLPNEKENENPVAHPETEDSSFVDNIAEAMKLIEKTEKHLPIPVRPSCSLVRMLRRQGIYVDAYKPLEIHSALYMENEAGIACDITPRGWENTPVICSLAQLEVTGNDVLAGLSTGVNKEPRALAGQHSCRLYHHA